MYQIDFHKPLHIHFIGIGGISMSGLAEILLGEAFPISGSDSKVSELTQHLEEKGAKFISASELLTLQTILTLWYTQRQFTRIIRNLPVPKKKVFL